MNVTFRPGNIIRSYLHVKITLKMYTYNISNNISTGTDYKKYTTLFPQVGLLFSLPSCNFKATTVYR